MKTVNVIITGGTIDSEWNGSKDTVAVSDHSTLPMYFEELEKNLKFPFKLTFTEICMKDSRAIDDEDRKEIVKAIEENSAKKIMITHGTYTMPETARYIKKHIRRKDQTIVLTGSMVPIKGFDFSDGPFNLGFAIAMMEKLDPGVYVCMNTIVFDPEEVAKNTSEGKFYSVFKEEQ